MSEKLAIIDCGTNTFHLLIVAINSDHVEPLVKDKIVVKIGEGGINQKIIVPEAFKRATVALKVFKQTIDSHQVANVFAFATSAFRNAANGEELKTAIKSETSIDIEIIPGEREAELIFYGVNSAIDINETALVMDIGGGSVEFIIGKKDEIYWRRSFEIGAQRLLDNFHKTEPIAGDDLNDLSDFLKKNLKELSKKLKEFNPQLLIGSSGTFDTLSDIYCEKYNVERDINAKEVPFAMEAFNEIYQELITKTREDRLKIPGMMAMRVDMIVVATAIIDFILKEHTFSEIRVSTYALKEGVLDQILQSQL